MINKEALKSELVGLINKHVVNWLDGEHPRCEYLVDKILDYSTSYGKIKIIDKEDKKI